MDTQQRLFGTDGVRGVANRDLTCPMAFGLGSAAVQLFGPTLVIGRDTRISGGMLEAALVAGITSQGGKALLAGIIPTPAVALLIRELGAHGGIVISASHNPPQDNGIKFFDAEGFKPSSQIEDQLEEGMKRATEQGVGKEEEQAAALPTGLAVGTAEHIADAHERYISHAVSILEREGIFLEGLTVAVDCGNGAAHYSTPEALRRLKAEVVAINNEGDGSIINVGSGSTNLEQLKKLVVDTKADVGIAHDGDADRVIAVSASGVEIDGDYIEAICALDRMAVSGMPGNTVVSTVMCNIGFTQAMEEAGLQVIKTSVGDSNVLAAMRKGNYVIGGEQSGHMIFLEHNTTGDGLVTALMLIAAMQRSGKTLDVLAAESMTKYPQTLINVKVNDKEFKALLDTNTAIADATAEAESEMQKCGGGRVLIRASGTEPLVRVMVEAAEKSMADRVAQELASLVEVELA